MGHNGRRQIVNPSPNLDKIPKEGAQRAAAMLSAHPSGQAQRLGPDPRRRKRRESQTCSNSNYSPSEPPCCVGNLKKWSRFVALEPYRRTVVDDEPMSSADKSVTRGSWEANEEALHRLLSLTTDAVFIEVDGTVVVTNEAGAALYGHDGPDDLVGRSTTTLVPEHLEELITSRPWRLKQQIETDRWAVEEILRADGSKQRVQVRSTAVEWNAQPAALVLLRPLSSEDQDEMSILRRRDSATKVFGSVSMALALAPEDQLDETIVSILGEIAEAAEVDRSYVIQFNREAETLSCTHEWCRDGIEPQQGFVRDFRISDFPWSVGVITDAGRIHVQDLSTLGPEADPEKASFAPYDVRSLLCVPMIVEGSVRGLVGFNAVHRTALWPEEVIDQVAAVSDAIATALTRRDAAAAVANARDEAERANALKDEFLARISHELRTPLNAVLGFSELLLLDEADQSRKRLLEAVQSSGKDLLTLVDNVLEVTSLDSGDEVLELEPVELNVVLQESLQRVASAAHDRQIEVSVEPIAESTSVIADRRKLSRVIEHLLRNSVDYNVDGGSVNVRFVGHALVIQDSGPGMSEDQLDKAFEPLDRLGAETSTIPGSGLGLNLVRLSVERMGGTLEISSTLGEGTSAAIRLPRPLQ